MVFHREHNTLRQYSWCCVEGISLLITSATIWSPIYANLWMCLVRDSGLFIFLTQILTLIMLMLRIGWGPNNTSKWQMEFNLAFKGLIWSYPAAVLSQLYWAWIQDKEFSHTHTHTHFCPICWLFSIPPVPYSLLDHSVQVLVLHMTCQTHFGSKLSATLSAATYSGSRFSCAIFDLPLSQRTVSNASLILS